MSTDTLLRIAQHAGMDVIEWIRQGLKRHGKTQIGLARALGVDQAAVSRMLKGKRRLQASELPKASRYLEEKVPQDFSPSNGGHVNRRVTKPSHGPEWTTEVGSSPALPALTSMPKDLEVRGTGEAGDGSADFELNGEVVDRIRRPPALVGAEGAFAIYARGSSMVPRYNPGDLLFIHPGRPITQGCDVLVELHNTEADERAGPPQIKIFISRSSEKVVLEQFNPAKRITIPARQVKRILRILRPNELFGV